MTLFRRATLPGLLPFLLPALLTGGGVLLPVAYLGVRALEADPLVLREILLRPKNLELLRNTLGLAVGVLGLATLVALPAAYLTTRTDLRGKRLWATLLTLPLAIPGYVGAYVLLSATGGSSPCPGPRGTGGPSSSSASPPTPTSSLPSAPPSWGWTPRWRGRPAPWAIPRGGSSSG